LRISHTTAHQPNCQAVWWLWLWPPQPGQGPSGPQVVRAVWAGARPHRHDRRGGYPHPRGECAGCRSPSPRL